MEAMIGTEQRKALPPLTLPHTHFVAFSQGPWNLDSHPAQKKRKAVERASTTVPADEDGSSYDGVKMCSELPAKGWSASEAYAALCPPGSSTADDSLFSLDDSATAYGMRLHAGDDPCQMARNKMMSVDFMLNPFEPSRPTKKRRSTDKPTPSWPTRACGSYRTTPGPSSDLLQHPCQRPPHPPLNRPFTTFSTLPGIPMEYAAYPGAVDVGRPGSCVLWHETEWEDFGDPEYWNGSAVSPTMSELAELELDHPAPVPQAPCTIETRFAPLSADKAEQERSQALTRRWNDLEAKLYAGFLKLLMRMHGEGCSMTDSATVWKICSEGMKTKFYHRGGMEFDIDMLSVADIKEWDVPSEWKWRVAECFDEVLAHF